MRESEEYKTFQYLQHWQRSKDPAALKRTFTEIGPLFSYCLKKMESLYGLLPRRKDGEDSLVHPLNVVLALRDAKISDELGLTAGLMHDYVEETVDLYRDQQNIEEDDQGIAVLDAYEEKIFMQLEQELLERHDKDKVKILIDALKLLTRHKRDFYYRSISNIYQHDNELVKEIAIRVKLADRMHNILSIECFSQEERNYQCFKNLFILNNTKKFLLENPSRVSMTQDIPSTQLLFKRCAKATYDAYLKMCDSCQEKGIIKIKSMIQLAFKKFALEKAGVWEVTKTDQNEVHLLRIFQGVIRKYDARLHHEWKLFESLKKSEYDYCRRFFADFNFSEEQIKAVIDYKDAYALKEIIAYLLYLPDYVVRKFLSSELSKDARIV